jgi:hypothetical protein
MRGWCNYFRFGSSTATFHYLDTFTWRRVTLWLRKRKYSVIPSLLARDEASLAWPATRRAERCWPPGR